MDSASLAQMLIKDKAVPEQQSVPAKAAATRERFPLNAMLPLVRRTEGKPSERVRIRAMFKSLQEEGLPVDAHNKPHHNPKVIVLDRYEQSGAVWRLDIKLQDENDPEGLDLLRIIQERLHAISIPMLGVGNTLTFRECSEADLLWVEAGLDNRWVDFEIEDAIQWSEAVGTDRWGAARWRDRGFTPEQAKEWFAVSVYYPETVANWHEAIGELAVPEIVGKFIQARLSPDQAAAARNIWSEIQN